MNSTRQLIGKQTVDVTLTLQTRLPLKAGRDNKYFKMTFPSQARSMIGAFIFDSPMCRMELLLNFIFETGLQLHIKYYVTKKIDKGKLSLELSFY